MRPLFVSGSFDPADVSIRYMSEADYAALLSDSAAGPKVFDGAGLIAYPSAAVKESSMKSAGIIGVWFNWLRSRATGNSKPPPEKMQDVPKHDQRMAKEFVAHRARTQFPGMHLRVPEENGRLVALTEYGSLFSHLKNAQGMQPGDVSELGVSTTKDGNMRVQY